MSGFCVWFVSKGMNNGSGWGKLVLIKYTKLDLGERLDQDVDKRTLGLV